MADRTELVEACLIGAAGGMRSMAPVAALSVRDLAGLGGRYRLVAGAGALGEVVADKLPTTPSRLSVPGLGTRLAMSSFAGAALAGPAGIPIASATAVASAYACAHARAALSERFGHAAVWGVIEDALAASLALAATRRR